MKKNNKRRLIIVALLAGGGLYLYYYYKKNGAMPWDPAPSQAPPTTQALLPPTQTSAPVVTQQPGTVTNPTQEPTPVSSAPPDADQVSTPPPTVVPTPAAAQAISVASTVAKDQAVFQTNFGLKGSTAPITKPLFCTPIPPIPNNGGLVMTEAQFQAGLRTLGADQFWQAALTSNPSLYVKGRGLVTPNHIPPIIQNECLNGINSAPGRLGLIAKPR